MDKELGYKSTIDNFPSDILDDIFGCMGINDFIKLVSNDEFIEENPSITQAIMKRMSSENIAYTNRVWQLTFFEMYMMVPSNGYLDKENLEFLEKLEDIQDLIEFYVKYVGTRVELQCPLTITYYIWNLMDIFEFLSIFKKINLNKVDEMNLRFNIELEFDPGILHLINLTQIIEEVSTYVPNSLTHISITNYTGDFQFDVSKFPNLQKIRFENTNVKFKSSFRKNLLIDTLILHPNCNGYNNNKPIILYKSLPINLKILKLGNCIINSRLMNYAIPTNLDTLILSRVKDFLNCFLERMILSNLPNLTNINIENILDSKNQLIKIWGADTCQQMNIFKFLNNINNLQKLTISNIQNDGNNGIWDITNFPLLQELSFHRSFITCLKLPPKLKQVSLSNNNITNFSRVVLPYLPPTLTYLNIADNPINWDTETKPIKLPSNLTFCKLSNTGIGSNLHKIEFPDSIKILSLEVNQLTCVENIKFPKKLVNLGIGSNYIPNINSCLDLPSLVHTIHMTENRLKGSIDLSHNLNGDELNIQVLYLNYNQFNTIELFKFPRNLKLLNFDDCHIPNLKNVKFPSTIVELSFNGCDINKIQKITFEDDSNLQYLNLANNKLTESCLKQITFPDKVETLNLSHNKIESVDSKKFQNLKHLKFLNLSHNKLKKIQLNLNSNLNVLDVSINLIKLVQLTFARDSNLKIINLCHNKLNNFNFHMLGHGVNGIHHNSLIEIDLTENKLYEDDLSKLLNENNYPINLKALLIGYTGLQDQFGYDIGKNIMNSNYCQGKKIDVPDL